MTYIEMMKKLHGNKEVYYVGQRRVEIRREKPEENKQEESSYEFERNCLSY